jgi:hypothetical protein
MSEMTPETAQDGFLTVLKALHAEAVTNAYAARRNLNDALAHQMRIERHIAKLEGHATTEVLQ